MNVDIGVTEASLRNAFCIDAGSRARGSRVPGLCADDGTGWRPLHGLRQGKRNS